MKNQDVSKEFSEGDVEIDLKELLSILLNKLWFILIAAILFGVGAFFISKYMITPMYQSSTQIYVMDKEENTSISYSDVQLGSQLTSDYMTLIKSRPVTEAVIENLGLNMSPQNLANRITIDNPNNTRILTIIVESRDPMSAKIMADEVRDAAAQQIQRVMGIEFVNVVEEANIPGTSSSPNITTNTLIGTILGVFLSIFIIFIKFTLDDHIKTPEDIEKHLDLSVLTVIPKNNINKNNKTLRR